MNWADYFYYDETSPSFLRWKVSRGTRAKCGGVAGYVHRRKDGRETYRVNLAGSNYLVHRVIWELMNGLLKAEEEIDHKDGDSLNNTSTNLRKADDEINSKNKRKYINNSSGVTGVSRATVREKDYWVCNWVETSGRKVGRMFSINKYGENGAKDLAILTRNTAMAKLDGYTERHGK